MTRLRRHAIAWLAASTVAAGSLVVVPPAAAKPRMLCSVRLQLSEAYLSIGRVHLSLGATQSASYWFGRAEGVITGC
jgi:hypothetical protein